MEPLPCLGKIWLSSYRGRKLLANQIARFFKFKYLPNCLNVSDNYSNGDKKPQHKESEYTVVISG